jgi:hypothetical protein
METLKSGDRMNDIRKKLITDKTKPGLWRVTLNNPPINAFDDGVYDEFYDLVGEIEADESLKVVTFESANPDFFIAHYSTAEPRSRFGVPQWIDPAMRLAQSSVLNDRATADSEQESSTIAHSLRHSSSGALWLVASCTAGRAWPPLQVVLTLPWVDIASWIAARKAEKDRTARGAPRLSCGRSKQNASKASSLRSLVCFNGVA